MPAIWKGLASLTLEDFARGTCPVASHPIDRKNGTARQRQGYRYCVTCSTLLPQRTSARRTVCGNGLHNLMKPDARDKQGRCRVCRKTRAYVVRRAKLEGKPVPSAHREQIPALKGSTRRSQRTTGPGAVMPPVEVRLGAACSPATAYLFEPRAADESGASMVARHTAAAELCDGCPVWKLCREWYLGERSPALLAAL